MKKFKLEEKVFEAEDAMGVIDFMRKDSWSETQNDKEFLRKTAKYANMWSGKNFRYDTKEALVEDLLSSGLLVEVQDGES
jgi:hypothetical protein|tara:strand:- start:506 stop:745 length:240 start_codon:yes stop_codon:yes gene_type:complete